MREPSPCWSAHPRALQQGSLSGASNRVDSLSHLFSEQRARARATRTTVQLVEPTSATLARLEALRASITAGHVPRVLSFGGGVNSVSLLLADARDEAHVDLVVLADTGEEHERTIRYWNERIVPFCDERGIPAVRLTSQKGRLVDYYTNRCALPSVHLRDCTRKFKVSVVRSFLRDLGVTAGVTVLGIAWDEMERMRTSDVRWLRNEYPLIERRMTREACEALIGAHGWPSPGKSGCVGCPFMGRRGIARFYRENPREFARWERMEARAIAKNPRIRLVPRAPPLSAYRDTTQRAAMDAALDELDGGECLAGVCARTTPGAPPARRVPLAS